ncbi:unnamed protein product [Ilex paraguariensis]|uniref:Uncharacterized protein n=1 Tax=Ilex paraguariensis TaxID=185542 RepID=A0ABC8U2D5_9AQUA
MLKSKLYSKKQASSIFSRHMLVRTLPTRKRNEGSTKFIKESSVELRCLTQIHIVLHYNMSSW